ncbi:MAG: prepilin-type N-terminal cleavage/methylation domain-containing protein [Lachnospiraceae bacterium]|nr:prepilin-type N-terminal cleavage/methylation domain-containing protein [Lachnospiraceae bacterium]
MKHNEGLSLVELIVIIAIMGVLVSVVGISVTVVSRQKVSNAASDVRGQFQTAQTIAMSKDNCYMQFEQNANGETVFTIHSSNNAILDRVTVSEKISITVGYGSSTLNMSSCGVVRIYYDRESGAIRDAFLCGTSSSDGTSVGNIDTIRFSNGSKSVTLHLTKLTGKVSY